MAKRWNVRAARRPAAGVGAAGVAVAIVAVAVVAVAVLIQGLAGFPDEGVHITGSDQYRYLADARAVPDDPTLGKRPAVTVLAAPLVRAPGLPERSWITALNLALTICLALAAGAFAVTVTRGGAWAMAAAGIAAGTWWGTQRLTIGYTANLLALTLFIAALTVIARPGRSRGRMVVFGALMFGAGFAHPFLELVWMAILSGATLLQLAARVVRHGRSHVLRRAARDGVFDPLIAATVAAGAVAFVSFVLLGASPASLVDLRGVHLSLSARGTEMPLPLFDGLSPHLAVAAVLAAAGSVATRARRQSGRRASRRGPAAVPHLIAWGVVVVLGTMASLVGTGPWYRFVYQATAFPLAAGIILAAAARTPRTIVRSRPIARALSLACVMLVGLPALWELAFTSSLFTARTHAVRAHGRTQVAANEVAAYIAKVHPEGAIVLVAPGGSAASVMAASAGIDVIRAAAPHGYENRVFVYPGSAERALADLPPEPVHDDPALATYVNRIIDLRWEQVRPHIEHADLLIVREFLPENDPSFTRMAAGSPDRLASPRLLVLRGPVAALGTTPPEPFETPTANNVAAAALALVAVAGLAGGGFAVLAVRHLRAPTGTALALAPAAGIAAILPVMAALALAGGDPGGPAAIASVALTGALGWGAAGRTATARRSSILPAAEYRPPFGVTCAHRIVSTGESGRRGMRDRATRSS